ncbi:hypothetical protein ES704_00286 [subsurface metagenome]|jgi:pimeloyl-ACP methyl ester carboxylesterase
MVFKKVLKFGVISLTYFMLSIIGGGNLVGFAQAEANFDNNLVGIWQGKLEVSGISLRIIFNIAKDAEGKLTATMDSPDQRAKDIPVEEVTFKDGFLHLEVKTAGGFFEGKVKENFLSIEGELNQAGQSFPLVLERVEEIAKVNPPQEPKKPYPYKEEEVTYKNKDAGITLAGTLTFPFEKGPFPAVLLITGSGAQDRNETVLNHKPFLVLADYLTRLGIVVLRVDDRGVGGSTGDFLQATSEDFAGDVLTGIEYLKSRKEIDPRQIGLIGHSEGAIIAPMVAAQSPDVAFIVMMGGMGITGEEILYLQSALILKVNGVSDELITKSRALQESIYKVLKKEKDDAVAAEELHEIIENAKLQLSEEEREKILFGAFIEPPIKLIPWYRYFLTNDPKTALMKVKCPVLAINGEKDLQALPKESLQSIEEALIAGGNKDYTVKELPNLNHLFQTAQTGALSEYSQIEETIAPEALDLVGKWILDRTGQMSYLLKKE